MKPKNLAAGDWTDTPVDGPSDMKFCKALVGKKICMTPQGHTAHMAKFAAKKARFIAKRQLHINLFKEMGDNYVKGLKTTIDVASDAAAEVASGAMLMARIAFNAFERYGCTFDSEGNMIEPSLESCPRMENPQLWLQANGKNIRKDVLKRMITIGLAIEAAAKNTNIDPHDHFRRFLQVSEDDDFANMDFGELNNYKAFVMKLSTMENDKQRYMYIKANKEMLAEVPFAKIRVFFRKMIKPEIKKALTKYHVQKLAAFKAQRNCFLRLLKIETSIMCGAISANPSFL